MINDICVKEDDFVNHLPKLFFIFNNNYENNKSISDIKLNDKETNSLNNIANKLNEISKQNNMEFNEEGFKDFIRKIYYVKQNGGADSDSEDDQSEDDILPLTTYIDDDNSNRRMTISYFYSIIQLFIGIFSLVVSYYQFCNLIQRITGLSPESQIETVVQRIVENFFTEIQELGLYGYFSYLWRIINGEIYSHLYDSVRLNLQTFLMNSFQETTQTAIQNCQANVFNDQTIIGQIGNLFASYTRNVITSPVSCIMAHTGRGLSAQLIMQQENMLNTLTLIQTEGTSIMSFMYLGSVLIVPNTFYLLYGATADIISMIRQLLNRTRSNTIHVRPGQLSRLLSHRTTDNELRNLLNNMTIDNGRNNGRDNDEDNDDSFPPVGLGGYKSKKKYSRNKHKKSMRKHIYLYKRQTTRKYKKKHTRKRKIQKNKRK